MGDYYEFGFQEVDGYVKSGFIYKNENTGWNEVFVEFTDEQKGIANNWVEKSAALMDEQRDIIKGWINE